MSFTWFSCSENVTESLVAPEETGELENPAILAKSGAAERGMPELAKKMAQAFRNSQMRSALVGETAGSEGAEKILKLDELLQVQTSAGRFVDVLSVKSSLVAAINSHALGFDVYFPVKEHRTAILQDLQQDFLVAYYDGYLDDQQEQQFPAWDKGGNRVTLTTEEAPTVPVLILTQCEHKRIHDIPQPLACEDDCGGGGGGGGGLGVRLKFDWYTIYGSWDPWPAGDPEPFFEVKFRFNGWNVKDVGRTNVYGMNTGTHTISPTTIGDYYGSAAAIYPEAYIEVTDHDPANPDDKMEKYGGWFKINRSGQWQQWVQSLSQSKVIWNGDDNAVDLRLYVEYY